MVLVSQLFIQIPKKKRMMGGGSKKIIKIPALAGSCIWHFRVGRVRVTRGPRRPRAGAANGPRSCAAERARAGQESIPRDRRQAEKASGAAGRFRRKEAVYSSGHP